MTLTRMLDKIPTISRVPRSALTPVKRSAGPNAKIGLLLYDGFEELDFVGPWEVFGDAKLLSGKGSVVSIGATTSELVGANGLLVRPQHSFTSAPRLDVIVVPGSRGPALQKALADTALVDWLRTKGARCEWVTSVCTGAFLLYAAGFLTGRQATTHFSSVGALRALGVTVVEGVRFVRDDKVITSAGVTAGIDMALWLVGELHTPQFARDVQKYMEYYPVPPYQSVP